MTNILKSLSRPVQIFFLIISLVMTSILPGQAVYAEENAEIEPEVDPAHSSDNYVAVLYNNINGLPTPEANAIAQTREGFIWIGSYSGLIRYDGQTFERMDSTTGITSVVSLHVDKQDRLWVGTNDNGLALMDQNEFYMWSEEDGLGSPKISSIEEDTEGIIYVGTTSGITMITPDLELHRINDSLIAHIYIERMQLGSDGLIYCITNEDDIFTLKDGHLVDFYDHNKTRIQGITCIYPDPENPGLLYFGTENSNFYHGRLDSTIDELKFEDISPLFNVIDIKKFGDQIWVCGNNGIGVVDSHGFHYLDNMPLNNSVTEMMMDYEGNLWFISSRQGVMKLVSNKFVDLFERYGLEERVVNATCKYGDQLFIATDTGLVVLDEHGEVSAIPLKSAKTAGGESMEISDLLEYLSDCRIRSVIRDSKGRLWISTWRSFGLLLYDKGKLTVFTEADGLLSDHIRAVAETADGKILVAHSGGVSVIEGDQIIGSYSKYNGIVNPETLTVCAAPNGDILVGSNGAGIYVINWKGTKCIRTKDGLPSGIIMRIKYDQARGLFWIVTSNAIAYMTEDYKVTTVKKFPYSNNFDLYENSQGDMWILSSNGVYVVAAEELIANGEIKPVFYGIGSGLPCITTSNSYSELTPEGDLYIAGNTGVAKVNIEESLEDISELKQAVPYIDADGTVLYPDQDGTFTVPAGVQKLTVYGFVYNYSLTEPLVCYHMEGFDRTSETVSLDKLGPVTYTNLPGGEYQFVMELKDAMGKGSKVLSVPIIKEKALYEQLWFYCILAVLIALLIGLLFQTYIRRKMAVLELRHKEEAERERISNELQMANQIQHAMLPHDFPPFPDRKEFDIYAVMDPAREVGGDFYDYFLIDDDHVCLVMADVSGKGIPAALFMMISKSMLKTIAGMGRSAAEILTRTNELISANNKLDMFVTVWIGILEISTGKLTAANAGHEYPVLKRAGGLYELVKDKHGLVLGGMSGLKYKEYELLLSPGDRLFLYTDGVPEATAADETMFGNDRMLAALNKEEDIPPREVLMNVRRAVDAFVQDAEQFDDLTMLCIEYKGK